MKRFNESLIARRYLTWFDLTNMKGEVSAIRWSLSLDLILTRGRIAGSTMDAMSDAIEGADVMLYGVSLRYKESSNCRLVRCHSRSAFNFIGQCSQTAGMTELDIAGSKLCPSARARYDPDHDAEGLLAKGLARSDHGDEALVPVLGC